MSAEMAATALAALGIEVGPVTLLGAGNSSTAWLCSSGSARDEWVVRTPIPASGRRPSAHAEALISSLMPAHALVPRWRVVDVGGVTCTVSPRLSGSPIPMGHSWSEELVADVAEVLGACHRLIDTPGTSGWGPLADRSDQLTGVSADEPSGVVDRWFLAPIGGFDEFLVGDRAIVHSDLHRQHILLDDDGRLAGLLDFGDAFIGSPAWDLALLRHYYGNDVADGVANLIPDGARLIAASQGLMPSIVDYKRAKAAAGR